MSDTTSQHLTYRRAESGHDSGDDESVEGGPKGDLPPTVFGDIVHKLCEQRVAGHDRDRVRRIADQFARNSGVDSSVLTAETVDTHIEHAAAALSYLDSLTGAWRRDEWSVEIELDGGSIRGDIDHLIGDTESFHIVDYKTNRLTTADAIDDRATHYRW